MAIAPPPKGYSSMDEYLLKNPLPPPTAVEKILVGADYVLATLIIVGMACIPFTVVFILYGIDGIGITVAGIAVLFFLFYLVGNIVTKR